MKYHQLKIKLYKTYPQIEPANLPKGLFAWVREDLLEGIIDGNELRGLISEKQGVSDVIFSFIFTDNETKDFPGQKANFIIE